MRAGLQRANIELRRRPHVTCPVEPAARRRPFIGFASWSASGEGQLAGEISTSSSRPGEFEDDPNVTNKKFPGNPTQSFRSSSNRSPASGRYELVDWVRSFAGEARRIVRGAVQRKGTGQIEDSEGSRSRDVEHPLERDPSPFGGSRVDLDLVDDRPRPPGARAPTRGGAHRCGTSSSTGTRAGRATRSSCPGAPGPSAAPCGSRCRSPSAEPGGRGLDPLEDALGRARPGPRPPRHPGRTRGGRSPHHRGARPGTPRRARAGSAGARSTNPARAGTSPP